jgi:transcriptional regulatory protein GAL4
MATLPSRRAESGYLGRSTWWSQRIKTNWNPGNSSGSNILRTISDILPVKSLRSRASQPVQSSPTDTSYTGSPSMPVNLADTTTINGLIDAYFMWYNPSYPIIHERNFRDEYQNRHHIHPRSSWHSLFFLVLAIGHWTLTEESEAEKSNYYTAARSRLSMRMLESGNILNVQAFLLMVCSEMRLDYLTGSVADVHEGQLSSKKRSAKYGV